MQTSPELRLLAQLGSLVVGRLRLIVLVVGGEVGHVGVEIIRHAIDVSVGLLERLLHILHSSYQSLILIIWDIVMSLMLLLFVAGRSCPIPVVCPNLAPLVVAAAHVGPM
jgi:hypothetical protein